MRISDVRLNNKTLSFKSQNENNGFVLGYDDEVSRQRRDFLREHFYNNVMPYQSIYEKEPRLEKYESDKVLAQLLGVKKLSDVEKLKEISATARVETPKKQALGIDYELMKAVSTYNKEPVWSSERIIQVYRGSTPFEDLANLKLLKNAGVDTIVDLCGYSSAEELCKLYGLNYHRFRVSENIFSHDAFMGTPGGGGGISPKVWWIPLLTASPIT